MAELKFYTVVDPFSNIPTDYVEIDNGNGNKTYMLKATYDEMIAQQPEVS